MTKVLPSRIKSPFSPLARLIAPTVVPCLFASPDRVSPRLIVTRAVAGFFGFGFDATVFGFGLGELEATAGLGLEEDDEAAGFGEEEPPEVFGVTEATAGLDRAALRLALPPEPGGGVIGAVVTCSFLATRSGPGAGSDHSERRFHFDGLSAHSST